MEGIRDLKQELDEAKTTLVSLNQNIRRIIGHNNLVRSDKQNCSESKRNDFDRSTQIIGLKRGLKRRSNDTKSVFNRLSGPVRAIDVEVKPRLNSRVIKELPSRQEVVAAQGIDSESKARNKRIFGSLIGTLHKFCQEESRLKEKEDKKAQIERKLEEQQLQERANLKREREALFIDRKRKQIEIRMLEAKMNRLKDFEAWKRTVENLRQNIKTKTKPHLYFRPKHLNKKTEKYLQENQMLVDIVIEEKQKCLKKELLELESHFKNDVIDEDLENEGKNNDDDVELKNKALNEKLKLLYQHNPPTGDLHHGKTHPKLLKTSALSSMVVLIKSNDTEEAENQV